MMNSFALRNIINLTQLQGTASHPGRIPDGSGFPIFLAIEQLAAKQASIPSEKFLPDSDGDVLKSLGNSRRIDFTKVTIAPVEKGAELAYNKKTPYWILDTGCSIPDRGIQNPVSRIQHQASSIKQSSNQAIKHRASSIKSQVSSLRSPVPGLLSQLSYIMSCVYPIANKVVKGDIILPQATGDAHRLDVSLMNAGADVRTTFKTQALHHTSYVMRHRHDVTQPSVMHIAAPQPETSERVVRTSPLDQLFVRFEPTTDHEPPITDHRLPITDHGSRTHDVVYTNAREVLPRSFVSRPGVIPDDITGSPQVIVLSRAPAEKRIFYANPKSNTPDSWAKAAGNIAERNPGDVITSVKHSSVYIEEDSEVSVQAQAKGTSEAYRQPETEHASRVDANQVKTSVQVKKVIYVPSGNAELEQREIGETGERPVISNATYSRSGSPADDVRNTPIREDNHGNSEPQLRIETGDYRPTHQIEARIDASSRGMGDFPHSSRGMGDFPHRQISQHVFIEQGSPKLSLQDNGVRFNTVSSSAFEGASVAEKVHASKQQEIISQKPSEYVRVEDNVQEIQIELAGEKNLDSTHQPLRQETNPQDMQGYVKHPQLNGEVRSEMQYAAASLDAFEGTPVDEKVQESQLQEIIPKIPQEPVRMERNVQEIQPELAAEEKDDRIHQPLQQEISLQKVQRYGKHPEPNDGAKIGMRYGNAPSYTFEEASVDEKVQESYPQEIIPRIPQEPTRIEGHIQEIQPEPVAEEKVDRIHQPSPQEIGPQNVQEHGKHIGPDDAEIEVRYGATPLNTFEGASVAEKVQKSQPQEVILQTVKEIQPEPVVEEQADRLHQPLRQETGPQEVQEYGKHPELNDEIKIETRRGIASPDAFEAGSVAGNIQKSQPQEVILQAVQESVLAKDEVQEIQPELSRNKETGRIQQLVQQEVGSQNVREYGENPEFRVESQPFGKEIQATASMPELQDKIPFYVSKMVAGERAEAIWIQLEPEHLGKVKLRVLLSDNKISVNLSVSRPETRGIIELQVPDIRRSLAQHEINITEFRVSVENGFSNSNPRYSNLFHDNANTNSRPAYEQGDWNRSKGEHSTKQRYYRSDSLVDLLV